MILRASCFSVSHRNEKDFDRTRKQDEDKIKEDFDTISKAIDEVLNDMKTNWKAYAVEGFEWWLNTNFQGLHSTDWKSFTNNLAEFMNEYYNPEKGNYNWGIIACGGCIVRSEEIGPEKGLSLKTIHCLQTWPRVKSKFIMFSRILEEKFERWTVFCCLWLSIGFHY